MTRLVTPCGDAAALAPVRVVIWGLGRVFERRVGGLLRMRDEGQVVLVGAVDAAAQTSAEREGIPVVTPAAAAALEPDYVIIMATARADEVMCDAVAAGIPHERLLRHGILDVPGIDLRLLGRVRKGVPSIISNGLWGERVCETLGAPCDSPFAGTSLSDENYLRLLSNLAHYLSVETPCYQGERISWAGTSYHSCLIDDVEVGLSADVGFDEAWARWREGCARVRWDDLFLEMDTCDPEAERAFHELRGGRPGVCFVPYESELDGSVTLSLGEGEHSFVQSVGRAACGRGLVGHSLLGLLMGEGACRRDEVAQDATDVALWGYGQLGHRVLDEMRRGRFGAYRVTGVFDRAHVGERTDAGALPVCDPDDIPALFSRGSFEGVVVTVGNPGAAGEIRALLAGWGVPELPISKGFAGFCEPEAVAGTFCPPFAVRSEGYRLVGVRDVFGAVTHSPYELLHLFDAAGNVLGANWMRGDERWFPEVILVPRFPADRLARAVVHKGPVCAAARLWAENYGHVIFQTLDQVALMEEAGYAGRYLLVRTPFTVELMRLMGIASERIVWMNELDADVPHRFEELYVVEQDYSSFGTFARNNAPALLKAVGRIEEGLAADDRDLPRRLFVRRIGTRRLLGADELLERYGFVTTVPEEHSVEDQIRLFRAADVVVTPSGANSFNALFMRPGSAFVETFGQDGTFTWVSEALLLKGVRHLIVRQPAYERPQEGTRGDYQVSAAELEHAIRNAIELARTGATHGHHV